VTIIVTPTTTGDKYCQYLHQVLPLQSSSSISISGRDIVLNIDNILLLKINFFMTALVMHWLAVSGTYFAKLRGKDMNMGMEGKGNPPMSKFNKNW